MRYLLIFIITLLCFQTFGQYYSSGSDPSRLRWRQIKTPTARLVFEKNFEKEALRLAAFIDSVAPLVSADLNHSPARINILIHNHTGYSNGFVTWAPRRVELYSTPHQNINSIDWLEHLTLHEYRHVVQINKLNQGFTRAASYIMGEQATGLVLGMYMPLWFLEGDAIIAETSLTKSGRGRSFEFNQELKAQLVDNGIYSYDKAYLGSYKNMVPNYYKMGYPLAALIHTQNGSEVWEKTINHVGRSIWVPNPFHRSLKQNTGLGTKEMYNYLFKQLRDEYTLEVNKLTTTNYKTIGDFNYDYAHFKYPVAISDSIIVCELKGPGLRPQILEMDISNGKTKTLTYTGIREIEPISANNEYVVWSELKYHARWENESYSIIRGYNFKTGKTKDITKKTRFFSPSIHPYKPIIAAVESSTDYKFFVNVIDAVSGKVISRTESPGNQYILTPTWDKEGNTIVLILQGKNGKGIYLFNPDSSKWTMVKEPTFDEIRNPVKSGNDIWFSAKGDVSEEIFYLNLTDRKISQITSSKFGAAHPAVLNNSKNIVYSNYTAKGYRIVETTGKNDFYTNTDTLKSYIDQLANKLSTPQPQTSIKKQNIDNYKVEKYSKLNLIGLHSWAPVFADLDEEKVYSGFNVMSQNLLGTMVITAGYNANPAFTTEKYQLNLSYRGFFPIIDLNINLGDSEIKRSGLFSNASDTFRLNINEQIDHLYLKAGLRVPLDLSKGKYMRQITPGIKLTLQQQTGYSYLKTFYTRVNNRLIPTGGEKQEIVKPVDFKGMEYSFLFYNLRRGSSRDVNYRMGQMAQLVYRNTPLGNYKAGSVFGIHTRLYFPGVLKHQAITIDNDLQITKNGDKAYVSGNYYRYYRLSNLFSYPRGYSSLYSDNLYTFRSTYQMPVLNPDMAIAGLAYLKRIRLNIFYDASIAGYSLLRKDNIITDSFRTTPYSAGVELFADVNFFRFILPFNVGYRFGYKNITTSVFNEIIINTGFRGFLVNKH